MTNYEDAVRKGDRLESLIARFVRAERAEKEAQMVWILADGELGMPRPMPPEHAALRDAWQKTKAEVDAAHAEMERVAAWHDGEFKIPRAGG